MLAIPPFWASSKNALLRANTKPPVELVVADLDSYRRLVDFGKKHLNDTFVLDGDQSVSARDKILREIISNILAHRDYSNAYTAQFVIESNRIYTKNSNLPHGHGELKLNP